ncbi:DUF5316 family protein [Peribacillus sp. NPDC097295]|uniref:DUF5316 family protein n=1 Tax=Peribacillus sp. NPDC097295 TaxID=3364402 RepID=UPI00380CC1E6
MLKLFMIIGVVGICLSGILIGAWTTGPEQRANFHSETSEHRQFRTRISLYAGFIGILSLGIAGLIWYF